MTALAGLVLCGGASRRMGTDKALLPFGGVPLVVHVARRVAEAADPVFLAPGTPGRLGELGYPEVADAAEAAGPLGGLIGGLAASPHPLMAVVGADMPFASPKVLSMLASRIEDHDAAVPMTASGPQPLHAVYSTAALPMLDTALVDGRLALRDVVAALRVRLVEESEWRPVDPSGRFAFNVNRREELDAARKVAGSRGADEEKEEGAG